MNDLLTIVERFVSMTSMSVIVSSKYQVVIPKAVRRRLGVKPGQRLNVHADKDGNIVLQKDVAFDMDTLVQKYAGSMKGVWHDQGLTADEWLDKERGSWDK